MTGHGSTPNCQPRCPQRDAPRTPRPRWPAESWAQLVCSRARVLGLREPHPRRKPPPPPLPGQATPASVLHPCWELLTLCPVTSLWVLCPQGKRTPPNGRPLAAGWDGSRV